VRYTLEWLVCAVIAKCVPLLPRRICIGLAWMLGWLAYHLDGHGRKVALANLKLAFGDRFTEVERRRIARRSYQNFASTMLDLFWVRRLNDRNWTRYIEFAGAAEEYFRSLENPETPGTVAFTIHWGNFEWTSIAFGFRGFHVDVVAETFKNPRLSGLFRNARAISGQTIVRQEHSMIRFLKAVKRKKLVGMLVDLTLRPDQPSVIIDAFGRKMCVPTMHAVLVQRGGALLLPVVAEPLPGGKVRIAIDPPLTVPPCASLQQITQLCWDRMELRIRERPELWMWAYKHWRYRPASAAPGDYPFYANEQWQFEAMLAKQQSGQE